MKMLAIDSSALTATAALSEDNTLVCEMIEHTALTHSQTLMPMIDHLLTRAGWNCADIDTFVCAKGPGSFTGLRIGIGTVKGLAMGADKPVIGVSTLKALAYNMVGCEKLIVPIMDARRGEVYCGIYRTVGDRLCEVAPDRAMPLRELLEELKEDSLFLGDGVPVHKETILEVLGEKTHFAPLSHQLPRASSLIVAAQDEPTLTFHELAPTYLRKSQAERELEERNKPL